MAIEISDIELRKYSDTGYCIITNAYQ